MDALLPVGIGFGMGWPSGLFGVGDGFLMVPAMICRLGMPTSAVTGTSLFQVVFVAADATLLQAVQLGTVDLLLTMLLLLLSGVAGVRLGTAMGSRLRGEEMRALLGLLVLSVAISLLWGLVRRPANLFGAGPALRPRGRPSPLSCGVFPPQEIWTGRFPSALRLLFLGQATKNRTCNNSRDGVRFHRGGSGEARPRVSHAKLVQPHSRWPACVVAWISRGLSRVPATILL